MPFRFSIAILAAVTGSTMLAQAAHTKNIMITGYWPPTNEMIRPFSNNPDQNPDGWIGENWEGLGYNIYSFFPEFPDDTFPVGVGDFTVDYQDTSDDFWRITGEVDPVAIITFSRGNPGKDWEVEYRQRNLRTWYADYEAPFQPTPSPPDDSEKSGFVRYSSLPMDDIVDDVKEADLGLRPYVDRRGYGGAFLSEFMAYHGTWYRDIHADPDDETWCIAGGHIHVGDQVTTEIGFEATQISLRSLIEYVDDIIPEPSTGIALLLLTLAVRPLRRV